MNTNLLQAIRSWVSGAPDPGPAADWAVIQSGILRANESELSAVLHEFFDCEPIVLEVKDVVRNWSGLSPGFRRQVAEALIFHGYDDEAAQFID